MVTAGAEILALYRAANPPPDLSDVAERGCDERLIAAAGRWAKVFSAPIEEFRNVPFGRSRKSETGRTVTSRESPAASVR